MSFLLVGHKRYLIKCGCCNEKVEIYYGDGTLEINGVMGSAEDWGEILSPLLGVGKREGGGMARLARWSGAWEGS